MEVFDHRHLFTTVTCQLYGQVEEVSIAALDLIWKPTGASFALSLPIPAWVLWS